MYVIAGITGQTGSAAAEALIAQGHKVRGLTRDASKAHSWQGRAEIVEVDLTDTKALAGALEGAEGAYLLIPPSWTTADYAAYVAPFITSIRQAVAVAKLPRLVFLSSIGANHEKRTGPIQFLHTLEAALAEQTHLTFLRPGYFHENIGGSLEPAQGGTLPVFADPAAALAMVATRDIGAEVARQLLIPADKAERIVQLAGPVDYSFADVANALSAVLGHAVNPLRLPPTAIVEPLKQTGAGQIAELYAEMNQAMEDGLLTFDASLPLVRGVTPLNDTLVRLTQA